MELSKDVLEFIRLLNENKVKYLIIGGWAVAFHGKPRYTKDIDFLVGRDEENAKKLIKVLVDFGFGSLDISEADFLHENYIIQLGFEPNRIDILTGAVTVDFEAAFKKAISFTKNNIQCLVIDRDSLIANKTAAGRPQDLADVSFLSKKLDKKE